MNRFFCFVILNCIAFAHVIGRDLSLSVDIVQFRLSDSSTECRILYALPDTSLSYKTTLEGYVGSLYFNVEAQNQATKVRASMEWIIDNMSQNPVVLHEKNLVGGKSLFLEKGEYQLSISAVDLNDSTRKASVTIPLNIKSFSGNTIESADIITASVLEIMDTLSPSMWSKQFQRNGLILVPNPSLECIGSNPELKLYTELYHCPVGDTLDITYSIKDAAKREVVSIPFVKSIPANNIVEFVTIPLDGLASGVYSIAMNASTRTSKQSTMSLKKFYVVNPEMPPELATTFSEDELFQQSEFSTYSELRIKEEFDKAQCLANSQEISLWKSLSELNAQQKFMYRFWKERDPNSETPVNERLEDFRKAIKYANTYFSNPQFKEGWRSDRGRVVRKYGMPTQVDRKYMSSSARPYETWFYAEIQGGAYFYFVDVRDINNHILVHSTAINEPRNENWFSQFANTDSNNPNNNGTGLR